MISCNGLCPIPVVERPFEYLIVDCVGPLLMSKTGRRYILTVMCKSTRYPAAIPLHSIKIKPFLKALTTFMSTFDVPRVVQTDQLMSRTCVTAAVFAVAKPARLFEGTSQGLLAGTTNSESKRNMQFYYT